jgi:hypothetical protein
MDPEGGLMAEKEPPRLEAFAGTSFDEAAKWGVADLYPELEEELRRALDGGRPFTTGWYSARKEPQSGRVTREATWGPVNVEAGVCMDDGKDLIDAIVWEAAGKNEFAGSGREALMKLGVPEAQVVLQMHSLLDELADVISSGENCEERQETLPPDASFQDVAGALDALATEADQTQTAAYEEAVEYIKVRLGRGGAKDWSPRAPFGKED